MFETTAANADANQRIVDVDGQQYVLCEYVGDAPRRGIYVEGNEANDNQLPQGFLVTQPPRSVTRPHFHEANQFQVFVEGDGLFGKRSASPLTVQYANARTPYGPIKAGDDGVRYFTLRQRWDPGAKYMPEMRHKFVRGNQRARLAAATSPHADADLEQMQGVTSETVLPEESDGLLAQFWCMGPNQTAQLPPAADGGGQYHIVIAGAITGESGAVLDRFSCQYVYPEDAASELRATSGGAAVLLLRFPRSASAQQTVGQ